MSMLCATSKVLKMLFTLTQFATEIGNNVELFFSFIYNGFQNLTYIGELLFSGVVFLASCVGNLLTSCIEGSTIVVLEFYFFLRDLADLKDELAHFLAAGFNKCSNSMIAIFTYVLNFSQHLYSTILGIVDAVIYMLSSMLIFFNSFLHLVGESFIFLLQAMFLDFGALIIEIQCWLKTSFVYILIGLITSSCNLVSFCVCHLCHLFRNIPIASCLGLLVVLASLILGKLYYSQITRTAKLGILYSRIAALELLKEAKGFLLLCVTYLRSLVDCCATYLKNDHISLPSTASDKKSPNPEDLQRQLEIEREEKLCVVCRDRIKTFVLLPCRHYCLCQTCLYAILSNQASCPICRHYVQDSLKIFS